MLKLRTKFITLLLVPCLVTDLSWGLVSELSAHNHGQSQYDQTYFFLGQALAGRAWLSSRTLIASTPRLGLQTLFKETEFVRRGAVEANTAKGGGPGLLSPLTHLRINLIIERAWRRAEGYRGTQLQGKRQNWFVHFPQSQERLNDVFGLLRQIEAVVLPNNLGTIRIQDYLTSASIVLLELPDANGLIYEESPNFWQASHVGGQYNSIYIPKTLFTSLDNNEIAALLLHDAIELAAKRIAIEKGIPWDLPLAEAVQRLAEEREVRFIGHSQNGLASRLDDAILRVKKTFAIAPVSRIILPETYLMERRPPFPAPTHAMDPVLLQQWRQRLESIRNHGLLPSALSGSMGIEVMRSCDRRGNPDIHGVIVNPVFGTEMKNYSFTDLSLIEFGGPAREESVLNVETRFKPIQLRLLGPEKYLAGLAHLYPELFRQLLQEAWLRGVLYKGNITMLPVLLERETLADAGRLSFQDRLLSGVMFVGKVDTLRQQHHVVSRFKQTFMGETLVADGSVELSELSYVLAPRAFFPLAAEIFGKTGVQVIAVENVISRQESRHIGRFVLPDYESALRKIIHDAPDVVLWAHIHRLPTPEEIGLSRIYAEPWDPLHTWQVEGEGHLPDADSFQVFYFSGARWGSVTWSQNFWKAFWGLLGVTVVHEVGGHYFFARLFRQRVPWSTSNYFWHGQIPVTGFARYMGAVANFVAGTVLMVTLGQIATFSSLGHLGDRMIAFVAAMQLIGGIIEILNPRGDFAPVHAKIRQAA